MTREKKDWGEVEHVFISPDVAVSYLEIRGRTFCSLHRHLHRFNHFTVIRGSIVIACFGEGELPSDGDIRFTLDRGKSFTVAPRVWHQFRVYEPSLVIETYWTTDGSPVDVNDIDRKTIGGVIRPATSSYGDLATDDRY